MNNEKALLTGFFSTIGDKECLEKVEEWLNEENISYDILPYHNDITPCIRGAKTLEQITPGSYSHLIVICGPCWPSVFSDFGINLKEFEHCIRIGINLTMVKPLDEWNPYDVLFERDSDRQKRPDLSLLTSTERVPVIGTCFIEAQGEYGDRQGHEEVFAIVNAFTSKHNIATVDIDTRWPLHRNKFGYQTPEQIISVMSRMDLIITNRLHGMVFSIKSGTPPIVIDGIRGGDKVSKQAKTLGWPAAEIVDDLTVEKLETWMNWCVSPEAKVTVASVYSQSKTSLSPLKEELLSVFKTPRKPSGIPVNTGISPQKLGFKNSCLKYGYKIGRKIKKAIKV